ncbi:MAG: PEP-CTERM sorting domain-containing protein [Planctomycetes bacterium]|nr:PEP-CTERM sorting domain-containing protein [Planctomycetota bacterium]
MSKAKCVVKVGFLVSAVVVLLAVPVAKADLEGGLIRFEASSSSGNGVLNLGPRDAWFSGHKGYGGQWDWFQMYLARPVDIVVDGQPDQVLGTVKSMNLTYVNDPQVNLNFSVQAGAVDTTFTIASALLSFPTITSAEAVASAAFSVTDLNGTGVTLSGLGPQNGAFVAQYNGWAAMLLGTTYADVIDEVKTTMPYGTNSVSIDVPEVGTNPIGDPVDDISSLIKFGLTANDLASGTTTFVVTPEPGSLALLALGVLVAGRRR